MTVQQLFFNGVDGASGSYLLPPLTPRDVAAAARGEPRDSEQVKELMRWLARMREPTLGPKEGVDSKDLAATGWGVIFSHDADPAVRAALGELLELRQREAGARHDASRREWYGVPAESGYRCP